MSILLPSELQKRFITTAMYKRSRQYFDIHKLNHIQMKQQQSRRRPYLDSTNGSIDNRLQESFVSAQVKLNHRLQTQFNKHQKRFFHDDQDETQTSYSIQGKGKTLDMSKMLSRNYFTKQSTECKNQSHFCNYQNYKIPTNHKIDFNKFTVNKKQKAKQSASTCRRCITRIKSQLENNNELNGQQTGKIHQKLIFDESIFKTMVDYKKYDKQKTQRSQKHTPQKNYDKIMIGQQLTKKKPKGAAPEFYHGLHKWNSAQMDNRLSKQNQYFIKVYNAEKQKQVDWSIIKRKTDLIDKRKREIMLRKNIPDVKGEICDQLYFRRNF